MAVSGPGERLTLRAWLAQVREALATARDNWPQRRAEWAAPPSERPVVIDIEKWWKQRNGDRTR